MKYVSLVFALLYSLVVNADVRYPTDYSPAAEEKFESYQKAINQELTANQLLTKNCNVNFVYSTINGAEDILISQNPAKPLLIFNAFYNMNSETMHRVIITTDTAKKKVTQVDAEVYALEETNTGDLSDPVFTTEYVLKNKVTCIVKPL